MFFLKQGSRYFIAYNTYTFAKLNFTSPPNVDSKNEEDLVNGVRCRI